MKDEKPFAYLAVHKRDGQPGKAFAIGDEDYTKRAINEWKGDSPADTPAEREAEEPAEPDFSHASALTEALARAVDFGLSQYELIMVSSIMPSLFAGVMAREHVLKPTMDIAQLIEDDEHTSLYSLSEDQYLDLISKRDSFKQMTAGVAALPKATLMSIVATFDTIIVDILSKMLRLDDKWLQTSERTLPLARLTTAVTLEELFAEAIADEIYQFSRGSHDEQAKYIESTFGIGIKKHWKRWADYIEVFERRNLIAHGEVTFNKRYVSICKAAGHKGSEKVLGQTVELTSEYLRQACDVLLEFALLLPFSLWRKVARDKEQEAFENLSEAAFKLISSRRYVPAERILEFALGLEKVNVSQEVRQRLVVNRASAARHSGDKEKSKAILDEVDWSASSDLFKLCVSSIRGDVEDVACLLPAVKGSNALTGRAFKQWPCFAFVREEDRIKQAFQEVFGEPLIVAAGSETGESSETENSADAPVLH